MIYLQPFNRKDFDQLISWSASPEMLMQYAGPSFTFPLTIAQLEATLADEKRRAYSIMHRADNIIIGHAEIYFSNPATAHLCRILIGNENYRGKGLGLLTVQELLASAFTMNGIAAASLNVYDWNTRAIQCYTNAGFTVNNTLSPAHVNGQVWTTLNMRLTKQQWETRP